MLAAGSKPDDIMDFKMRPWLYSSSCCFDVWIPMEKGSIGFKNQRLPTRTRRSHI